MESGSREAQGRPVPASDFAITDQVILITGAGRGIGRALARGLSAAGARVACVDRDGGAVEQVALDLGARSASAHRCDIGSEQQVKALVQNCLGRWGRIDALINNAGIYLRKQVIEHTLSDWETVFGVNVTGSFLCAREVLPHMISRKTGRIINFTSALGVRSHPGGAAYGASKAAIANFTNTLHQEVADHGVRVVAIAPGLTNTTLATQGQTEEYIRRIAGQYPGGRLGEPEDIVGLVHFLLSPAAEHLSGTTIYVRPVGG